MTPSVHSSRQQQLFQQRSAMYAELESALEDEADPLASYDGLVKWTLQNYVNHTDSGLLELLEESVRKFKDDTRYKTGDLRYVKLWILFANHVDNPALVYAYMMEKGIGKPYALFYEEYVEALERAGRYSEAETVLTLGIRTQAKPLKHLQSFQNDYHARRASGKLVPTKVHPFREGTCSAALIAIRTDPLRNIAPRRAGSALPSTLSIPSNGQHDVSMTTTQAIQPTAPTRPNPYAHLNAAPVPGKRPEKLRFDLTLLLEPDGTEYSFEEARARYLGLLGKKWPPPPPPNAAAISRVSSSSDAVVKERSVKVDFNDHGSNPVRSTRRQSVTVTINTKQALEDVFDMYNSPVKENPDVEDVAADERPLTVETPVGLRTPAAASRPSVLQDENAVVTATKPRAFQPYVDQKRENITPGPLKFMPVTAKTPGANAFTPNVARQALVAKELVTPVPAFKVVRPQQNAITHVTYDSKPLAEEKDEPSGIDVFGGDDMTTDEFTEEFTNPPPPPLQPRSFVPFVDENTDKCPLPTARPENIPASATSKILKFQVHRDENAPSVPAIRRPGVGQRATSQSFLRPLCFEDQAPFNIDEADSKEQPCIDDGGGLQEIDDGQRFAMSSRFAHFDVMTPITERTFEFTGSTRAVDTPGSDRSSMCDRGFMALDAQDVAEKLAAELQEEEAGEQEAWSIADAMAATPAAIPDSKYLDAPSVDENESNYASSSFEQKRAPFRVSDGFTIEPNHSNLLSSGIIVESITTSNTEVFSARPGFDPPNPCNPSDPAIVSKLLSVLPAEPNHRNLGTHVANNLNNMQQFVDKRARRGSGASGSGRASDGSDGFRLELDGDLFEVLDKLGEGGFGAVFMAKNLSDSRRRLEEDDEEEDEDEEDGLVAVKAVRPTNLWESYVLRRVISAVPEDLRRSIIRPHCLYAFKDESFLILDLCQQGTLLEIVNRATDISVGQPGGGVDELLVMFFTVELLRILQGLHNRGFIHGDLKIDNCLIRLEDVPGGSSAWSSEYSPLGEGGWACKGLKLIDFGRTIDTNLYPSGQKFVADWKTDIRDCVEMREGRPWTFQTDYSGLASIIYCMLFGKYIETVGNTDPEGIRRVKPSQSMKRYWQMDLWSRLFDALLNPCQLRPDGSLPITDELMILRGEFESWIQTNCNKAGKNLKGMLKKIEIASLRKMPRK